ncbi:hypothetical protein IEQ34_010485 [Dendrobium chrysotoxum]|uniref:Uncharacterized protein n=1 Tax=Dendrobium chrysotoxum TaxID=161865 RepID=A0AAV7GTT1_DENCH|nr:hypothetical protein IEQ34_010485 [Dendrobium chrysotoxum]
MDSRGGSNGMGGLSLNVSFITNLRSLTCTFFLPTTTRRTSSCAFFKALEFLIRFAIAHSIVAADVSVPAIIRSYRREVVKEMSYKLDVLVCGALVGGCKARNGIALQRK